MLDIKFIRENSDTVKKGLAAKNVQISLDGLLAMDKTRRENLIALDDLRGKKN